MNVWWNAKTVRNGIITNVLDSKRTHGHGHVQLVEINLY